MGSRSSAELAKSSAANKGDRQRIHCLRPLDEVSDARPAQTKQGNITTDPKTNFGERRGAWTNFRRRV